jgi:hypothetical protein
MSWSKVKPGKKPLMWWYHKILCEIGYKYFGSGSDVYYKHLEIMCDKYGFNLYGEPGYKKQVYK